MTPYITGTQQVQDIEDTEHLKTLQHLAMKCPQLAEFSVSEARSS